MKKERKMMYKQAWIFFKQIKQKIKNKRMEIDRDRNYQRYKRIKKKEKQYLKVKQ